MFLNSIGRGRNLECLAELDQIRLALVHLTLCQRLLSLSQALLLVGNKVTETPNEAIGGLYGRQLRKKIYTWCIPSLVLTYFLYPEQGREERLQKLLLPLHLLV